MPQLTAGMFLIICPMLFLAGFVDSIAGGGGIISLPAYLIAGVPVHAAIATNKLSSFCGTSVTAARFIKNHLVDFTLALPSAAAAAIGSAIGARISLEAGEKVLKYILFAVLPVAAFVVLRNRSFGEEREKASSDVRALAVCVVASLVIGAYDGFYGPGTGTFLIVAFTTLAGLGIRQANAQAKIVNLATNAAALTVYLINGQVIVALGLAGAACNMLGNYLGSGLVITKGPKIAKPVIVIVLILLLIKIITE